MQQLEQLMEKLRPFYALVQVHGLKSRGTFDDNIEAWQKLIS